MKNLWGEKAWLWEPKVFSDLCRCLCLCLWRTSQCTLDCLLHLSTLCVKWKQNVSELCCCLLTAVHILMWGISPPALLCWHLWITDVLLKRRECQEVVFGHDLLHLLKSCLPPFNWTSHFCWSGGCQCAKISWSALVTCPGRSSPSQWKVVPFLGWFGNVDDCLPLLSRGWIPCHGCSVSKAFKLCLAEAALGNCTFKSVSWVMLRTACCFQGVTDGTVEMTNASSEWALEKSKLLVFWSPCCLSETAGIHQVCWWWKQEMLIMSHSPCLALAVHLIWIRRAQHCLAVVGADVQWSSKSLKLGRSWCPIQSNACDRFWSSCPICCLGLDDVSSTWTALVTSLCLWECWSWTWWLQVLMQSFKTVLKNMFAAGFVAGFAGAAHADKYCCSCCTSTACKNLLLRALLSLRSFRPIRYQYLLFPVGPLVKEPIFVLSTRFLLVG